VNRGLFLADLRVDSEARSRFSHIPKTLNFKLFYSSQYAKVNRMYLFWHLVFAIVLAVSLYRLTAPNPAHLHLIAAISAGVLPDLDHLLCWDPEYLSHLLPTYFGEGLALTLRTSVYPYILHLWLWPLSLLAASLLTRKSRLHIYLAAAVAGWALHLALDGILVVI